MRDGSPFECAGSDDQNEIEVMAQDAPPTSGKLLPAAEQRRDQIQGGVNLGFAAAKDVGVEVWIAHPDDRVATHGGRQR
jgi:hypothetical protein